MNRFAVWCVVGAMTIQAAVVAHGAFSQPTEAQIAAAAKDPAANMAALLKDASAEQAAQVVKVVVAKVLGLGLASDVQSARIVAVISGALAAVPSQMQVAFSSALGTAVAGSGAIAAIPGTVSAIQGAIATAGGAQGAALAEAFGAAYQVAMQNIGGTGQKTKNDPPPVASGYEGQTL